MLTAIAHQIFDQVIRMSVADDAIELSELGEEIEEEEEKEAELIVLQQIDRIDLEVNLAKSFVTIQSQPRPLDIYCKIPVPPPELV